MPSKHVPKQQLTSQNIFLWTSVFAVIISLNLSYLPEAGTLSVCIFQTKEPKALTHQAHPTR